MNIVTIQLMVCIIEAYTPYCVEPVKDRFELNIKRTNIESIQSTKYRFIPEIGYKEILKTKEEKKDMNGCVINTRSDKVYFYEFPCNKLKKILK